jgi:hypothetical protein
MHQMTQLDMLKALHRIQRVLLHITQTLDLAEASKKEGSDTMVDPKVAALITQFDNATDRIAARIQKLIDTGSLSDDSAAALQAEVDKLNLLGQDPTNPVPPETAVS